MVHEDNRRVIHDWAQGSFKSLKAVFVKERIAIGDHFHKEKDEVFFLAAGVIEELTIGNVVMENVHPPFSITIPRNTYHKFICAPGSIIFGGATELFDPADEITKTEYSG